MWTLLVLVAGCGTPERCGPSEATVLRAIDGDTIELQDGTRVRYLMIDTPEITGGKNECYGEEARTANAALVEGKRIRLAYDVECTDNYDRLLAYVSISGTEINLRMVERGYACVLYIPPNGEDRVREFEAVELQARSYEIGMWGACEEVACD
ncbi:MAG: thermonuclease family protein [Lentisphaeria bacterium]|nr:thermonuclease family protein [Lentisphaeria bacterium]